MDCFWGGQYPRVQGLGCRVHGSLPTLGSALHPSMYQNPIYGDPAEKYLSS